ncbi:unnamed protein product [Somion occarium]|uniref:Bud22 domain-containing protein n=1 Tax=Somion occarium TaxID=3059160 RepID=A0ABP1E1J9_9APHY
MSPNDENKPNLKRKRAPGTEDDIGTRISGKLHHDAREVRKAAKKAKAFETQKLVKKLKGLRAKNPGSSEMADLEAQLEIIKVIDHEPFGNTALKTKLKKDKLLAQNEHVIAAISTELEANLIAPTTPGSPAAKVHAHILSSKALAAEVTSVVQGLRNVLSPAKADQVPGEEDEEFNVPEPPRKAAKIEPELKTAKNADDEDEDDTSAGSEWSEEVLNVVDKDDEEIDDGGWESGSVDGGEDSESDSDSDSDGEDENGSRLTKKQGKIAPIPPAKGKDGISAAKSVIKASTSAAASTFLPSLSVGFTRGDSDASDVEDAEVDAVDGGTRKNRRGQRARRAIWEKKYGGNANHVKKQREENYRAPKGRQGQERHNPQSGGHPHGRSTSGPSRAQPSQNLQRSAEKLKKEEKPLHPSWEAKRRLKEKLNPSLVAPQGKKIIFD